MTTKQYPHYVKAVHIVPSSCAEVHMVGEYVAVRWNIKKQVTKKQIEQDGVTYTGELVAWVRYDKPYISFESVRVSDRDGEVWLDEDDPVSSGIDLRMAKQLADELQKAVDYLAFIETMDKVG